jgi:hypothetical protein
MSTKGLKHIDEILPLNDNDNACMEELKSVLNKYKALDRFGITLLHKHFEMEEDEVLLEECDEENRTLLLKPVKQSSIKSAKSIETNWRLDTLTSMARCISLCQYDSTTPSRHNGIKKHYKEK